MIYILKHIDIEGPGSIEGYLKAKGRDYKVLELWDSACPARSEEEGGGCLPKDLSEVSALVSLGGSMNVYEDDKHPFLKEEADLIGKLLKLERPILGICLGAQLLARACGAEVRKAEKEEVGWFKVELTKEGEVANLFNGVNDAFDVFHWHGDTFAVPEEGTLLATSELVKNQAFRVGSCAYGLQFHIEMNRELLHNWINRYIDEAERPKYRDDFINGYALREDSYNKTADSIYANFFG